MGRTFGKNDWFKGGEYVAMKEALTPEGCRLVRRFFSDLIDCAEQANLSNEKLNVARFMKEWRKTNTGGCVA